MNAPFRMLINALLLSACAAGRAPAQPDLVGPPWTVTEIDGAAPVTPGRVTINFASDGRFDGQAPCNRYGGSFTKKGDSLSFLEMQATAMGCVDEAANAQERRFFDALSAVTRYGVDGSSGLVLYAGEAARIKATRPTSE